MDRREFIRKSIIAGIAAGTVSKLPDTFAKSRDINENYDLVAVKNGQPDEMFDKAIEALGGMKKYVKKGDKVVVKPNIGWDVPVERAGNTHPKLVKRIIEHCFDAGASDVYVFDHTCDNWSKCYRNSGIESAVDQTDAKLVPGNNEGDYVEVNIPGGKKLKSAKVHRLIKEADVFLNVPILKNHGSTKLTICMKNLMGVVWDRGYWHANDLHQCIADFPLYRKPDLNIVDAYYVMTKNGPRGVSKADVVKKQYQIISSDIVAADAAATKVFGYEPDDIEYITIADQMGIGKMDLNSLNINRIIL